MRSQDKKRLSKIKDIYIVDGDEEVTICGYSSDESDDFDLGSYYTIERALEVLDEIQNILQPKVITKNIDSSIEQSVQNLVHIVNRTYETISPLNTYVYDMPEE